MGEVISYCIKETWMGNRGTNLYLSFKYGKAHRVDGSYYRREGKNLKYYEPAFCN